MVYTLISGSNGVIRDADNSRIRNDPESRAWRDYQAWLALGNTPTPAVVPPPRPPIASFEQFIGLLTATERDAFVNSTDPKIRLFLLRAAGRGNIDLTDGVIVASIATYAVVAGILTAARAATILQGPP